MPLLLSWRDDRRALLMGDRLMSGVVVGGIVPALIAAAVLGLVNVTVKPILFILTLPDHLPDARPLHLRHNAMMLGLVAWVVDGFEVRSLLSGIGLAIIVAIIHAVAVSLFGRIGKDGRTSVAAPCAALSGP